MEVKLTLAIMILLFAGTIIVYVFDEDHDYVGLFGALVICLMLTAANLGSFNPREREYKHKKKPVVHIECNGKKCDTTYIYKF
jgi:hypothetical protein